MKKIYRVIFLLSLCMGFTACEKTDYKHPLHRAQGK